MPRPLRRRAEKCVEEYASWSGSWFRSPQWLQPLFHGTLERLTLYYPYNQRRETIIALRTITYDRANERHVVVFDASAERVRQKLFCNSPRKLFGISQQRLAEAGRPRHFGSVHEFTRSVDKRAPVSGPPSPHGIEVFESKTDRVHHPVTGGARGVRSVFFQTLPYGRKQCSRRPGTGVFFQSRYVRRRLRWRCTQD